MTLRHFRIFVTVCDTMNMTKAANALFMSQSAVSQSIAELEKYYGIRLFERLNRKLYLSEAGGKLLSYARHMLRMNQEIEQDMRTLSQSGTLRIGASVTVGAYVLPQLVRSFRERFPTIRIEVTENNTAKIERLLMTDQLDLGIVEGDTASADLLSVPLTEDELVLICAPEHPFAGQKTVEPAALTREGFIIREEGSGTRKTFETVMAAANIPWHAVWTCTNADSIRMAVAANLGVSVISKLSIAQDVESGRLCTAQVRSLHFVRMLKTIYHRNKYITTPMQEFMDVCAEYYHTKEA
ncbi:MAG: LysR family transcriptional regulator [Eubacteriales bacterium]|nr:LysR family transcriptional regulator [Eubacteriales bacterium]